MALTPAEKQKRYRERQKQKAAQAADASYDLIARSFCEYFYTDPDVGSFDMAFDLAGIKPPEFEDDTGPKPLYPDQHPDDVFEGYSDDSLGRAEVMVGLLLDAGVFLATAINRFKIEEIEARIAEIEQSDLSDEKTRKKALADIVRLNKIRDRLNKSVRWDVPQWRVKDV